MQTIKLYQCSSEKKKDYPEYPLGLGYLQTNCHGAKIEIVTDSKDLKDCDLIGLSANAHGVKEAVDILESTKIPVIIGGQGTLWKPLQRFPFKHIVIGEGERVLQKIIDGCEEKVLPGEMVEDLDSLKFPARGKCRPRVPVFTSRGCPFSCNFCSSQNYWQKARFHSADYVLGEVEYLLKKYPKMTSLWIFDDLFIANKPRFRALHKGWMKRRLHERLQITGFVRAAVFNREVGLMMKEMGFRKIRFGAESGSDRVLKLLNKGTTVAQNQQTIDAAHAVGLHATASFMHHIPTETAQERQATKDFIARNKGKLGVEGFYRFCAFPGTKFYDGEDLLSADMQVR